MAAPERDARLASTTPATPSIPWKRYLTTALPVDAVGDLTPPSLPALRITTETGPAAADTAGNCAAGTMNRPSIHASRPTPYRP